MIINRLPSKGVRLVAAPALLCAIGLSACGGFDSAASGEHLVKDYVKKFGQGKIEVKSVSCPGGVKQKVGGSYDVQGRAPRQDDGQGSRRHDHDPHGFGQQGRDHRRPGHPRPVVAGRADAARLP